MQKLAAQQKKIIAIAVLAILVLSLITINSQPGFLYHAPKVDTAAEKVQFQKHLAEQRKDYEAYLKSINADPEASKLLFEQAIDEKEVKAMVEAELDIKQAVKIPIVAAARIRVDSKTGEKPIKEYAQHLVKADAQLASQAQQAVRNMYLANANSGDLDNAMDLVAEHTKNISEIPVAKEAVAFQRAALGVYDSLDRQLKLAKDYQQSEQTDLKSSEFYRELVISDHELKVMNAEYKQLREKYPGLPSPNQVYAQQSSNLNPLIALGLVHQAEAFFGLGEFLIELLKDAVAAAAGAVLSRIMSFLIEKIEKVLVIVNYVFYGDAVANKYINDAMDKYVEDPINKALAKKFVKSMNCGKVDKLGIDQLARQQAAEYLGFDPKADFDVKSPDFYVEINRAGHIPAKADRQKIVAKDGAITYEQIAEKAKDAELKSEGKKVGLSAGGEGKPKIKLSLGAIQGTQTAGLIALLSSAAPSFRSVTGFITALVTSLVKAVINNFLFRDSTVSLKEQDRQACLSGVTQLDPIVPKDFVDNSTGNVTVNKDFIELCGNELYADACVNGVIPPTIDTTTPPPPPPGAGLVIDKTVYLVGEVPKYQITEAPPNSVVYFATDTNPRSLADGALVWVSFEREDGILQTDESGNWPGTGTTPWSDGWSCEERGKFTRLAKVGDKIYGFKYEVKDNPANP